MDIKSCDELLDEISKKGAYAFGAGFVGNRFLYGLKKHGKDKFLEGFLVSSGMSGHTKDGVSVRLVNDSTLDKEKIVCVAVHEALRDEVFCELKKNGFDNCVWIYPFLYDLMLGNSLIKNKEMPLIDIYFANRDFYALFVRYLMIEHFYGKNEFGSDLYVKAIAFHASQSAAEKRLSQFISLIKNYESNGYNRNRPVYVLENCKLIDGFHRFALALYHGNNMIACNVYRETEASGQFFEQSAKITEEFFLHSFTPMEVKIIKDAKKRLDAKFGI